MELAVLREIADGAKIAADARIGPFCVIGPDVTIGPRTTLGARVTVTGRTTIGSDNLIQDGTVLGEVPQDLKYHGGPTYLIIGDRNRLGVNVTAHVGTEVGGYVTRIGNDNVVEGGAHVAHDCFVDDHVHLGFGVLLAGHIRVESGAVLENMLGVTHFTTIGRFSLVAARTPVTRDVPPFTYFSSGGYYREHPAVRGVHEEGIRRAGLGEDEALALRLAIEHLLTEGHQTGLRLRELRDQPLTPAVRELCEFVQRSTLGRYGRFRETLRRMIPPEARPYLPPELLTQLKGAKQA
jgi:UDP-N-acetylglucosamine acyltransferase